MASAVQQGLLIGGLRPCALIHQSHWWGKLLKLPGPLVQVYPLLPLEPDALWGQGLFLKKDGIV